MTHCELCGNDEKNLLETKISGAVLNVCPNCTEHGVIIEEKEENNKTSNTKYSTNSKTVKNNVNKQKTSNNKFNSKQKNNNNSRNDEDYFDDVHNLSLNYGEKIRDARNSKGYTRKELANKMNIKESNLRNIESEKTQPVIELQDKLENILNIDLSVEDINY